MRKLIENGWFQFGSLAIASVVGAICSYFDRDGKTWWIALIIAVIGTVGAWHVFRPKMGKEIRKTLNRYSNWKDVYFTVGVVAVAVFLFAIIFTASTTGEILTFRQYDEEADALKGGLLNYISNYCYMLIASYVIVVLAQLPIYIAAGAVAGKMTGTSGNGIDLASSVCFWLSAEYFILQLTGFVSAIRLFEVILRLLGK